MSFQSPITKNIYSTHLPTYLFFISTCIGFQLNWTALHVLRFLYMFYIQRCTICALVTFLLNATWLDLNHGFNLSAHSSGAATQSYKRNKPTVWTARRQGLSSQPSCQQHADECIDRYLSKSSVAGHLYRIFAVGGQIKWTKFVQFVPRPTLRSLLLSRATVLRISISKEIYNRPVDCCKYIRRQVYKSNNNSRWACTQNVGVVHPAGAK